MRAILFALCLCGLGAQTANAQGTIPLAMAQQQDINGLPLAGCLLYFYVAGTVATPQNSFQDFGLTQTNPNPLTCDQTGRIPMFWLANGLIHARLTDASGNVQVDTTMQVLGPSSGGGGGGGTVDPTTIAATGDIKVRLTSETLTGWVMMNGQTIGSASSGATQRANADTQNLFVYLWNNCTNAHCPVIGGRGANGIADFNAAKQITIFDMRDSIVVGRDCMSSSCLGGLLGSNITSGGGDGVDTPAAFGGAANTTLAQTNLPNLNFPVIIPAGQGAHTHTLANGGGPLSAVPTGPFATGSSAQGASTNINVSTLPTMGGTAASGGSGTSFPNMNPFKLSTYYIKL